jgi:hypothetical protein
MKKTLRLDLQRLLRWKMKAYKALILATLIVLFSLITSPVFASSEAFVGVKEGDWIEYDITIEGTGTPPPTHDVRWMKIEVLAVDGAAFSVNLTARYANGTVGSAIWKYNFTEGNVGGWTIIPANLSPGEAFYDFAIHNNKPVNVTIQREEQKIVLGANRIVTYGNDSIRHIKEWDKATGFFIGSSEVIQNVTNKDGWYIDDLTVSTKAVATNMWSPQIMGNQAVFALVAAGIVLATVILTSTVIIAKRKPLNRVTQRYPIAGKKLVIGIFTFLLLGMGFLALIFFFWNVVGLSDAQINLIIQSYWIGLIVASMGFRKAGNYFVHGVVMAVVVISTVVGFSLVLVMSPPSGGSMGSYFTSPLKVAEIVAHSVLSIPAIAFGVWSVSIWRPNSSTFPVKSKRIVQLAVILWVLSYAAGVLGYIADYTHLFG